MDLSALSSICLLQLRTDPEIKVAFVTQFFAIIRKSARYRQASLSGKIIRAEPRLVLTAGSDADVHH